MLKDANVIAIITAGGRGLRMGTDIPKQFLSLGGESILHRTVDSFADAEIVDRIVITLPPDYVEAMKRDFPGIAVISGGDDRQASVENALMAIEIGADDIVLIHDGVRPFCTEDIINRVAESAYEFGAAIPGIKSTDTVRHEELGTLDRDKLYRVQTPQGFRGHIIKEAYRNASEDGFRGTDDAGLADRIGCKVMIVEGSEKNIKITRREDLPQSMRIGTGFDVHRFANDRKLILGGVDIPYERGLDGHSDADVAVHALMDSLLGAAGLPDIGRLFPDTDEAFKGISSILLLGRVEEILSEKGLSIGNVDITIICEMPKLAPYIDEMKNNIATALRTDVARIGIKATTTEKLGFTGRGEGIAAEAVSLIIG